MSIKPITPNQVILKRSEDIPDFVIQIFNECITKFWKGSASRFTQDAVIELILMNRDLKRNDVFDKGYLEIEPLYEALGWEVEYIKPSHYADTSTIRGFVFKRAE